MPLIDDRRKANRCRRYLDRRRYPRVAVNMGGVYFGNDSSVELRRGNFNIRGFFIDTFFPDPPGSTGTLRLFTNGRPQMLKLDVEVVWSCDRPGCPRTGMGLRLRDLSGRQRKILADWLLETAGPVAFPSLSS